ncbi:glycoprotease family protein [Cryptosporidium muris RN66]|uniref:N(6)-L-threonylcarbamoyladenine synthase n=1 Tax=Cryptosporidium muris (strain RN66) TaxID=441375 RepID=B6ACS2_CRYMR|nr:glycoprotease family protein [Cryptosporidium muris RN66]EEA05926.1 glycoprotease family protein [Cryptosporidium muris RN66]|eukprot:XP_002140275.1 glycoprotease family protein [Cryptosporidium muris RN66]
MKTNEGSKCAKFLSLGIESSANKIGVGIVSSSGQILANEKMTYVGPPGSGFLPKETASFHRSHIIELVKKALKSANVEHSSISIISYTQGPGMGAPLSVGAVVARVLSQLWGIPLVGVNHCVAHIEMGRLVTKVDNPVVLYASGGNTQIIGYSNHQYKIIGETLDIAIGNCIDRFARLMKLDNYPAAGYHVEKLAKKGKHFYQLPYVLKGMDLSFSGILTFGEELIISKQQELQEKQEELEIFYQDFCFSLQETIFAMLVEVTERAISLLSSDSILLVGGVGCNQRLIEMMELMASERNAHVCSMDDMYCIDNGAMIAHTGLLVYKCGIRTRLEDSGVSQKFRTDQVDILWRE